MGILWDDEPLVAPAPQYSIEVAAPRSTFMGVPSVSATRILAATPATFRSWTGRRYVDGVEYHGPVVFAADCEPYTGARECPCEDCQEFVRPECRPNATAVRGPQEGV